MQRDYQQFIERAGILWEEDGLPRIAGRIFALTLLSAAPRSLDDIAESLGVSKASVSNDARLLERLGFLERVSLPGDRRDYYQIADRSFDRVIAERARRVRLFHDLIEGGQKIEVASDDVRERLREYELAFSSISRALEGVLEDLASARRAAEGART